MKKLMILGGMIGFSTGLVCGTIQGCSGSAVLWRASVAALFCGYLLRWWGRVWIKALHQACEQRFSDLENNTENTGAKV